MKRIRNSLSEIMQRAMLLTFLVLALASPAYAAGPSASLEVLHSDSHELVLMVRCAPQMLDTVSYRGQSYLVPQLKGFSQTLDAVTGIAVPCVRELVSVPSPTAFHMVSAIAYSHQKSTTDKLLGFGAATPETLSDNPQTNTRSMSDVVMNVELKYLGISADKHVARMILPLLSIDTNSLSSVVYDSVMLRVGFDALASEPVPFEATSNRTFTLNDAANDQWKLSTQTKNKAVQLLSKKVPPSIQSETISDGKWIKLQVSEDGIYHIDASQLSKAGVTIPASKIESIKIFGNGGRELSELPSKSVENTLNEQAIIVKTNTDGSVADIIFYGNACRGFAYNNSTKSVEHYINHYSEKNYYFLTWGGRSGLRQQAVATPPGEIVHRPTQYTARMSNEDELVNAYLSGSGRRWFGQQLDAVIPRTFSTKLPGLLSSGTVTYVLDVAHRVGMETRNNAVVTVSENSNPVSSINLRGVYSGGYEEFISCKTVASIDASKISADGTSMLKFEYANPYVSGGGNGYLDFFEIHYPAQLSAVSDKVNIITDPGTIGNTQYTISGFSSAGILGFDVSDLRAPRLLTNTSTTGNIYSFVTSLDSQSCKRFFVSASLLSPEIQSVEWKNLRGTDFSADVIVVTPSDFESSAVAFKTYRQAQSGMNVQIFDIEDIYNEYGSGIADPSAVRDFIADAMKSWSHKPSYVVLWGDGHYDYKGISTQKKNYITTWQTDDVDSRLDVNIAGVYTSSYTTDDFFVRVIGDDDLIDLAIGRLPIDSPTSGEWMVEKIKHYEQRSARDVWRTSATFLADDSPTSNNEINGTTHVDQSEELTGDSSCVPTDIIQRKIYLAEYPAENIPKGRLKPRVTEDLLSMVNGHGTLLLNWIGHGNPKVWAHETVLNRDVTIPQFINLDKLFFLVAATCDFGRCDMTDSQSGAEMMLTSQRGGAIGTFSASRVSFSALNAVIGRAFFKQLFTRGNDGNYRRLGDVVWSTKQLHTGENDQKYFLLGDPTLRLLTPNLVVEFDSINGKSTSKQTRVEALSTMRVKGHIRPFGADNVIGDFNGSTTLSLFDSDIFRRFQDPSGLAIGDSSVFQVEKSGGALHRGNYSVASGRFNAEFVVPKDIEFSNSAGRLFAYAQSVDDRHAKGEINSFTVGGIDSLGVDDQDGPEIRLFMDARTFVAGDIVRKNPLLIVDLFDQTGINSTGIGIGHKIEAWIDDNIESIDLSEFYSSSLTDSHRGTAVKQLFALSPGYHSVRVRVWDVVNNYSEARTHFVVADNDSTVTSGRLLIYPNPFGQSTTILFTHNQTFAFNVDAKIYTTAGQLVRTFSREINALQAGSFLWDGKDDEGSALSQGSYSVILQLHSPDGSVETKSGQVVLLRY